MSTKGAHFYLTRLTALTKKAKINFEFLYNQEIVLRVLGVDPGLAIVGYGIVDSDSNNLKYITHGTILTPAEMPFQNRLLKICNDFRDLITLYKPDEIAFEELFFARNVTTALDVAAARGCLISVAAGINEHIYEYTPMQIKQAIVGYGRADKLQIQTMIKILLRLDDIPKPDDAADGLAAAITHINSGFAKEQFRMR